MAAVMTTRTPAAPRRCAERAGAPRATRPRIVSAVGPVSQPCPRVPPVPRASPRTFRRRRLCVLLGIVAVVVMAGRAGAALGSDSLAAPERAPSVARYVVQPGDSLWGAAQELAPDHDPREVVDVLVGARGNGPLMPGEVLRWQR